MTVFAAHDLAVRQIRVGTIAPGRFETPLQARLPDDVKTPLASAVLHPSRLAEHIRWDPMLNGETIRMDGAIRMPPR